MRRRLTVRFGRLGQPLFDGACWIGGLYGALSFRYDFRPPIHELLNLVDVVPLVLIGQWVVGYVSGLYRGRWLLGSSDELSVLGLTMASLTGVLVLVDLVAGRPHLMPVSVALGGGPPGVCARGRCSLPSTSPRGPPPQRSSPRRAENHRFRGW